MALNYLKIALGFILCMLVPGILQNMGFFQDEWTTSTNLTCPTTSGLVGNWTDCKPIGAIFYLEVFPSAVFYLPLLCLLICIWEYIGDKCDWDKSWESKWGQCNCVLWMFTIFCILLFPFAGISKLTGCIMFAANFPSAALGPSFRYCTAAGCIHILGTIYLLFNYFRKPPKSEDPDETSSSPETIIADSPSVNTPQHSDDNQAGSTTVMMVKETKMTLHTPNYRISIFQQECTLIYLLN